VECRDASFDIVFDVEAGCHSDTPEKVAALFAEVRRVLRPGGLFVQFGFFRSPSFDALGEPVKLAALLVERAWVIEKFHDELAWKRAAEAAGFSASDRRDLRAASMPSARRLHQQAKFFYTVMGTSARRLFARLVKPSTHNSISALMLPYAYELGAMEYTLNVLSRA
jgi:SAM-dependent methyltransferase